MEPEKESTTPQEATAKRFADMANNYQEEKESGTPAHLIHPTPEPETISKSRRGLAKHQTNPFIDATSLATKSRIKRVAEANGERLMVISGDTGEMLAPAGFWHAQEVDKTQFVKLYINGVKAFKELTNAGTRAFEFLYMEIQRNIGKDKVFLSFQMIDQTLTPIAKATFYRGMKELVEKGFIADSTIQCWFFVNPDYMWNGDRLAFVKEYRIKKAKGHRDELTADMFEALPNGKQSL